MEQHMYDSNAAVFTFGQMWIYFDNPYFFTSNYILLSLFGEMGILR